MMPSDKFSVHVTTVVLIKTVALSSSAQCVHHALPEWPMIPRGIEPRPLRPKRRMLPIHQGTFALEFNDV